MFFFLNLREEGGVRAGKKGREREGERNMGLPFIYASSVDSCMYSETRVQTRNPGV